MRVWALCHCEAGESTHQEVHEGLPSGQSYLRVVHPEATLAVILASMFLKNGLCALNPAKY